MATNISENIMWKCFSPFTVASERGIEYEGAIIAFFHFFITKKNKLEAFRLAFFRRSSPNLLQLLSTLIILIIVIYLWKFKINIKLTSKKAPGATYMQQIKLFYSFKPVFMRVFAVSSVIPTRSFRSAWASRPRERG